MGCFPPPAVGSRTRSLRDRHDRSHRKFRPRMPISFLLARVEYLKAPVLAVRVWSEVLALPRDRSRCASSPRRHSLPWPPPGPHESPACAGTSPGPHRPAASLPGLPPGWPRGDVSPTRHEGSIRGQKRRHRPPLADTLLPISAIGSHSSINRRVRPGLGCSIIDLDQAVIMRMINPSRTHPWVTCDLFG